MQITPVADKIFLKNSDAFEAGNHDFFIFFKKREIEWVT